ncbi:MAG: enoyl-CoA hydratase [Alphaproteobacteria bacterium]|nr:enoyl-CoA hydratase [Alphaproteobacteria bacterium]
MSHGSDRMQLVKQGQTATIIFDHPQRRNAMSIDMWRALPRMLDEIEADSAMRAIVLKGAGEEAFVAGADISEFDTHRGTPEAVLAYEELVDRANGRLANCPVPTIAMIRGFCIGGGLAIALNCDLRIATPCSVFAIPAAKLGLGYRHNGIRTLMNLVGPGFAREIFFTARQFTASEALGMGLVNRIAEISELEPQVQSICGLIAANAPLTLRAAKQAMLEIDKAPEGFNSVLCEQMVQACFASEDYKEGRRAFMEKRRPVFQGF